MSSTKGDKEKRKNTKFNNVKSRYKLNALKRYIEIHTTAHRRHKRKKKILQ